MQVTSSTDTERNLSVEKILEDIPGGGTVENGDFPTSSSGMEEGAYLGVDSSGIYHITKTARLAAALPSSGTSSLGVMVYDNHEFNVGDWVGNTGSTASGSQIISIAASGTSVNIMTLASSLSVDIAASGIIIQAATGDERGLGYLYSPVAVSANSFSLSDENTGVGLVVRGRVRKGLMPYGTDSTLEALLPLIRFV